MGNEANIIKLDEFEEYGLELWEILDKENPELQITMPAIKKSDKKELFSGFAYKEYFLDENGNPLEIIAFRENNKINKMDVQIIFNFIKELFKNKKIKSLKDSTKFIKDIYSKGINYSKDSVIGLIGELLFIEYAYDNGLENICDYYHDNDNDLFDFTYGKNNIEIKTFSTENKNIKISLQQLSHNTENTFYCTVKFKIKSNGINVIQLIEQLLVKEGLSDNFKLKLRSKITETSNDFMCQYIKFDYNKPNVVFTTYLPGAIQKNIPFFNEISDENKWKIIQRIDLTLNLGGVDDCTFKDFKDGFERL